MQSKDRQTTDDRRQTTDDRQQSPATCRLPSAAFKMDDVQEDNIVPQSNLTPRFVVGGIVVFLGLTILSLAIHIAKQPPESSVVYLDDENFEKQTASGIVLVNFYADWCGPCQMMIPAIESVATRFKGKAIVARVNGDHSPRHADKFRVFSYPTLVLLQDGLEVTRVAKFQTEPELVSLLETVLDQQL